MARGIRIVAVAMLAALMIVSAGCKAKEAEKPVPKVSPPAVKTAGTLMVGVDLSTPPFAGVDQKKRAGIDVDVAAAAAERLGLTVAYRDVKPSEAATALASGEVDVVLSVPLAGSGLTEIALAGTYVTDGPAFFAATEGTASVVPSITLDTVVAEKIGAQKGSEAYWLLRDFLGTESVKEYDTLRAAIEALDSGEIELVAGDALVGAYLIRDYQRVQFAGQAGPAMPLAAAVAKDNTVLSEALRDTFDQLAADGILGFIREKWVGALPELTVEESRPATPAP